MLYINCAWVQCHQLFHDSNRYNRKLEARIVSSHSSTSGSFLNPAPSCKLIPQGSLSGHYWIQNAGTGCANLEYCDMTRRCYNSTGGWMRVAHLNMTDINQLTLPFMIQTNYMYITKEDMWHSREEMCVHHIPSQ